jgi:glycosyltransferase involved in cell wall biosynthesis
VEAPPEAGDAARNSNSVVFSGTLTGKKGVISLIKAWPLVVKSVPEAQLHIFGKDGRTADGGSMQQFLGSMLNGERGTVHFHGHVVRKELFEVYRKAAAAVFPSYAEAFAVAPLEAMACGCPTIFSERGSGPELLTHERQGLLVDPDKPGDIAASIVRTLRDRQFAREIGDAGRTLVRQVFSVDRLVAQNEDFYRRCIRGFRERAISN